MNFITTPIYYVNDIPHIGHAYTTILADMLKKYYQMRGENAFLLTGTDEHGQKIQNSAKLKNTPTKAYADEISAKFKNLWDDFCIDYDYFVRTTDKSHAIGVQKAFALMFEKGDIYKGHYEGNYCISCETFFTKRQLINKNCPDCGKETNPLREESYFFALSKYEKKLLDWYKTAEILPLSKKNEVISFVENGLSDLSITRSTFEWGIKLPDSINDNKHIIYVWLDALLSYITPLGFGGDEGKMHFFNNATHFVGKDILRFHAIYWPAFLMSLNLPLPKKILAHGWWTKDGQKMSKSIGNVVNPKEIADEFGIEILRYFLIREVPFGQDGDFSQKALIERANGELSDTLGNLLNRFLGMSEKYFNLELKNGEFSAFEAEKNEVDEIIHALENFMQNMQPNRYLEELWRIFYIANSLITKCAPWELMKQNKAREVENLLIFIGNILAKGAIMLAPILPQSAAKIALSLGIQLDFNKLIKNKTMLASFNLTKIPPLFPKIDLKSAPASIKTTNPNTPMIKIDDFNKLEIRVGSILEARKIKDSTKLLIFQIDFGKYGIRQIVSGIAQHYDPNELIGTQVCAIINLKPSKIMGNESCGMILTSEDGRENLALISPRNAMENGSRIC